MDLPVLWDLRRRPAIRIYCGVVFGDLGRGSHFGPIFAAGFPLLLEDFYTAIEDFEKIFQKNEKNCKKTIGIREKMVYNEKEYGKVSELRCRRN